MASKWDTHQIEEKVIAILGEAVEAEAGYAFGRPYLSAYQLAIEFAARYPETFAALGQPLGGAGTGQHTSLAQYLAGALARRIRSGRITRVQGASMSNRHVREMVFGHGGEAVRSSLIGTAYPLSMFRLAE